jgi:large subunit ribosomal protein L5
VAAEKNAGKNQGKGKKGVSSVKLAAPGETRISPKMTPRLQVKYEKEVVPALVKQFGMTNPMQVPRVTKVVINCAVKEAVANPKVLDGTMDEIMAIAGQKPILTRARKSVAAFKVREGVPLGVTVTLRRARMYEFLERLIAIALPRVRDFKGVSPKAFDGRGNYSLGLKEQIIFPEVDYDRLDKIRGLTVTVVTSAENNEHARALLGEMGMPFRK